MEAGHCINAGGTVGRGRIWVVVIVFGFRSVRG